MRIKNWLYATLNTITKTFCIRVNRSTRRRTSQVVGCRSTTILAVAATAMLLSNTGLGQCNWPIFDAIRYSVGDLPSSIVTADFDGDGIDDIATANLASDSVSILKGHGDGTFGSQQNFFAGIGPSAVTTSDFNGDGITDLATANRSTHNIWLVLGNGDGTFAFATSFEVGSFPTSITTGDFDADGFTDLATANSDSNDVSVLLGNGNGTFSAQQTSSVGVFPGLLRRATSTQTEFWILPRPTENLMKRRC